MYVPDSLLSRRHLLRAGAVSTAVSASGWLCRLAAAEGAKPSAGRKRSCILLWMNGGPSTIDLWDLKPGHENGGPFEEIATTAPGLKISEHLPKLAGWGKHLAVVRSMTAKEGDHARATYLMRTGRLPGGPIQYPSIGSALSKELGVPDARLPNFVSVGPQRAFGGDAYGPGFLGPRYAPLVVAENERFDVNPTGALDDRMKVQDLARPKRIDGASAAARLDLLRGMHQSFAAGRPGPVTAGHVAAYDRAVQLMESADGKAFDLSTEADALRDRYGRNLFGQGCLLARRLVERGVPFVEVTLSGWDTHGENFTRVMGQCGALDAAWSSLMADLRDRGLLETTTVVCMGEFGRTPKINAQKGRDHYPAAWAAALAGGGIAGGQAVGKTGKDGMAVEERPVPTADFLATVCRAVGVDPERQNLSDVGRPIRIVDESAEPVEEVLS